MKTRYFCFAIIAILLSATLAVTVAYVFFYFTPRYGDTREHASAIGSTNVDSQTTTQSPVEKAVTDNSGEYKGDPPKYWTVATVTGDDKSSWNMKIMGELSVGGENHVCGSAYDMPVCYFFVEPKGNTAAKDQATRLVATTTFGIGGGLNRKSFMGFFDNDNFRFVSTGGDGGGEATKEFNLNLTSGNITEIYAEYKGNGKIFKVTSLGTPLLMVPIK